MVRRPAVVSAVIVIAAISRAVEFPVLDHLKATETLQHAQLAASELTQILEQVASTSYDTPDSWPKELCIRRVSLGSVDGLVLQGTDLLCGATGNCQTWVFRRDGAKWMSLFRDQAPIASGFGFDTQVSHGVRNLVLASTTSAETTAYTVFAYNGRAYLPKRCYLSRTAREVNSTREVACQ
jgi:hypothetical protein